MPYEGEHLTGAVPLQVTCSTCTSLAACIAQKDVAADIKGKNMLSASLRRLSAVDAFADCSYTKGVVSSCHGVIVAPLPDTGLRYRTRMTDEQSTYTYPEQEVQRRFEALIRAAQPKDDAAYQA